MDIQDGIRGHFTALLLREHTSVPFADPTGTPIPHKTTYETFNYIAIDW
jgi:hypothetical protein